MGEGEIERENIYFTLARPECGHMAAKSKVAYCSVCLASIMRPAMAFLSMVQQVMYVGLSLPRVSV